MDISPPVVDVDISLVTGTLIPQGQAYLNSLPRQVTLNIFESRTSERKISGSFQSLDLASDPLMTRSQIESFASYSMHNARLPFHSLPMELMTVIFLLIVPAETDIREEALKTLCLVCKLWHALILQCATLWTVLRHNNVASFPYFLATSLRRSLDLPLTIEIKNDHSNDMSKALKPHAGRVRSISYHGVDVGVVEVFTSAAVNLKVEFASSLWNEGHEWVENNKLQMRAGPALQSLCLSQVSIVHWYWGRMRNLKSLELKGLGNVSSSFFSHLLTAIKDSVYLRKLVLLDIYTDEQEDLPQGEPTAPEIILPVLRTFRIGGVPSVFAETLLSQLYAENVEEIYLEDEMPLSLLVEWLSASLGCRIQKATNIQLRLGASGRSQGPFFKFLGDLDEEIQIRIWSGIGEVCEQRLSWLGDLFSLKNNSPSLSLYLEGCNRNQSFDVPVTILEALGQLMHIHTAQNVDFTPVLEKLCVPRQSNGEGSEWGWPCPFLRSITMESCNANLYARASAHLVTTPLKPHDTRWKLEALSSSHKKGTKGIVLNAISMQSGSTG